MATTIAGHSVVMDVAEPASFPGAGGLRACKAAARDEDENLWTRPERETLGRDPRAGIYARLLVRRGAVSGVAEPITELLNAMRHRVPAGIDTPGARPRSLLELLTHRAPDGGEAPRG